MPVAVTHGERSKLAEDEEPVEEMEIGDTSLSIDVDAGGNSQVEEVDGSDDKWCHGLARHDENCRVSWAARHG
jgi:hypothetical protein